MNPVDQAERCLCDCGHVHLIGMGGIGMAGIAYLLQARGLNVSGCDLQPNRQTDWLRKNGITFHSGHDNLHIAGDVDWLIRSTAVPDSHPEVVRARELGLPVSRRGEVLPALMRDRASIAVSGTHGKTTTTALLAQILDCGFCVGGEIVGCEGVARDGTFMVVEADESDGTVAGYTPDYAVITNIEYDHMEHHESEAAFVGCFERLIKNTQKTVYFCPEDPVSAKLCAGNPKCQPFTFPDPPIPISLPGRHNQWNAAAAQAVARTWMTEDAIQRALTQVRPIRRRFETVYKNQGIRIISDYAHHPSEIAALIQTAQELDPRRLLAVFQPHRYTRTRALGSDFPPSFDGMDRLWITPVYSASEKPIPGGTTADLVQGFLPKWEGRLTECSSLKCAWQEVQAELREGDLLLIIGAGDIERMAEWARGLDAPLT